MGLKLAVTAVFALATLGAASPARSPEDTSASAPQHPATRSHQPGAMCPVEVPDTKVAYADSPDGGTMTFTTTSDVTGLRERVGNMAEHHNAMHAFTSTPVAMACPCPNCPTKGLSCEQCCGRAGPRRQGRAPGMAPRPMPMAPPSTATVNPIENGAQMTVKANDPADVVALRASMKGHVEQLQAGQCPMGMMSSTHRPAGPGPGPGPRW